MKEQYNQMMKEFDLLFIRNKNISDYEKSMIRTNIISDLSKRLENNNNIEEMTKTERTLNSVSSDPLHEDTAYNERDELFTKGKEILVRNLIEMSNNDLLSISHLLEIVATNELQEVNSRIKLENILVNLNLATINRLLDSRDSLSIDRLADKNQK